VLSVIRILIQKFGLFSGRIQQIQKTAEKVVLAACVVHSYLRDGVSVEDCVTDNIDAPSQFPYVTTFRRSDGSASEEYMIGRKSTDSALKVLGQCIGNWKEQEEGGQFQSNVINKHIYVEMSLRETLLDTERRSA
jgi:hypothetical protein